MTRIGDTAMRIDAYSPLDLVIELERDARYSVTYWATNAVTGREVTGREVTA